MLFNTIDFLIFLPIVFIVYWLIPRKKIQLRNLWILLSSYFFYGWWDFKFLGLLTASTTLDYFIGKKIETNTVKKQRKAYLLISIVFNLGLLSVFKYSNFFIESFSNQFLFFNQTFDTNRLKLIIPIGISFYTFQTLSYTIDIYRGKIKATDQWITFASFVSFFPQLVAGPIERAQHLLPQFQKEKTFNYENAKDGMRQILWGLFKKMVIANGIAPYVNEAFLNFDIQSGSMLLLALVLFSFQIYGDFSGYSDIAIGLARLFGINLSRNFNYPYFAHNIIEFWRRWHITLTHWFKDYLYIPLGGSKKNQWKTIRNILIVFLVSGVWHGSDETYIVWGLYHAMIYIPFFMIHKESKNKELFRSRKINSSLNYFVQVMITFLLISLGWSIFRAENLSQTLIIIKTIFSSSIIEYPRIFNLPIFNLYLSLVLLMLLVEWIQKNKQHGLDFSNRKIPFVLRQSIYVACCLFILVFSKQSQEFIYFQF